MPQLTTTEETFNKMHTMRLGTMVDAARELLAAAPGSQLDFAEMLTILVDREWTHRDNRKIAHRLKAAKLRGRANVEDVHLTPEEVVH
jgi:hypothetical protein